MTPPFSRLHLCMPEVEKHLLSRGAVNASFTQNQSVGRERAARTLFAEVVSTWQNTATHGDPLNELDIFCSVRIQAAIRQRLATLESLNEPQLDLHEFKARAKTIKELSGRTAHRTLRDVEKAIDDVLEEAATAFCKSVEFAAVDRPSAASEMIAQLRRAVAELDLPQAEFDHIARFHRLVGTLDEFATRRNSVARSSFDFAIAQLLHKCRQTHDLALRAVVAQLTHARLKICVSHCLTFLDEIDRRTAECLRCLDGIDGALQAMEKDASDRTLVSRTSVILPLDGPDDNQVLSAMMERQRCQNLHHLAIKMLGWLEHAVRDRAARDCPSLDATSVPLIKLMVAIGAASVADIFAQLFTEHLGGGHTLYELVERHGVARAAQYLYARAEHTCHLGARNTEMFNVPTAHLTIVRLPQPTGPRDNALRDQLRTEFQKLHDCTFTDGTADENAVTVVRIELGWPIGIEQSNRALLERYLQSGDQGHVPHLLGVLQESPSGEVCAEYRHMLNSCTP